MKSILFTITVSSIALIAFCNSSLNAQNVSICLRNNGKNICDSTLIFTTYSNVVEVNLDIFNPFKVKVGWQMQCVKLTRELFTYEALCFGEKNWDGACEHFSGNESTYKSHGPGIRSEKMGEVKIGINRFGAYDPSIPVSTGTILYQYNLLDDTGAIMRHFFIQITFKNQAKTTGLNNDQNTQTFTAYPNPVNTLLNIDIGEAKSGKIHIINAVGETLIEADIQTSQILSTENLETGMYILEYISAEGLVSRKRIFVQH